MRLAVIALLSSAPGCRYYLGDDPMPDGGLLCGGSLLSSPICLAAAPSGPLALAGSLDTQTDLPRDAYTGGGIGDFCVVSGNDVTIASKLTLAVTGRRLLIIFATNAITIDGALDAASHVRGSTGPGAN